jgi:hypothetical protein
MNKLLKLMGIIFVLSLLALQLSGCTESAMTLVLKVDMPKDGTTVNKPTVTVSGHLSGSQSAGTKVSINGADALVKEDKFSADVTLNEGKNVINIDATNGSAKLSEQVTVTYLPSKS